MEKKLVILDTDPGIDDAVAIGYLLNDSHVEVPLITTVSGNVGIDNVTNNVLTLLTFYGKKIPVAKGATEPLIRQSKDASDIHGASGLGNGQFDHYHPASDCLLNEHAIDAMYRVIKQANQKVTLVAIGPLTNIALLLKVYPDVKTHIAEIIFMGGALGRGNHGVYTEFNIGFDPEAAKIVFNSGLKLTMIGLEMGNKALITAQVKEKIAKINHFGEMFVSLFNDYRGNWVMQDTHMYDSTAIAYLLHPEMFTIKHVFGDVEINGQYTSGATICDLDGILNTEPNLFVATDIDTKAFENWFINGIKNMAS